MLCCLCDIVLYTDVRWIVDVVKSKEKPRVVKGYQSSRSAYMLVYRLRSLSAGLYALHCTGPDTVMHFIFPVGFKIYLSSSNMKHSQGI